MRHGGNFAPATGTSDRSTAAQAERKRRQTSPLNATHRDGNEHKSRSEPCRGFVWPTIRVASLYRGLKRTPVPRPVFPCVGSRPQTDGGGV